MFEKPPGPGDFFLFDFSNKHWRKDNHSYLKRKNSSYTLENQTKLRVDGRELLKCSYCVGDGSLTTSSTFKRRAYWLIDQPEYVFVHYLNESSSTKHSEATLNSGGPQQETDFDFMTPDQFEFHQKQENHYQVLQDKCTTQAGTAFEKAGSDLIMEEIKEKSEEQDR